LFDDDDDDDDDGQPSLQNTRYLTSPRLTSPPCFAWQAAQTKTTSLTQVSKNGQKHSFQINQPQARDQGKENKKTKKKRIGTRQGFAKKKQQGECE